jgi:DNA-binding GntR family transcriptional regulator
MTKRRLRALYEVVRVAAHAAGSLACDEVATGELADALDQIIDECDDASEARLVEWAMENGYPALETVLRYGR